MAIEGFDYKGFAESMAEQAKELVPADLKDHEKEYIVKTLGNFTMLAGEALYNDTQLNLNADQAVFITQIIAEWSFHKSIDLIHSGILPQYWDGIMQKIAFTIFEVAKQAIIRKIPQDQLLQAVEHHVVKVYKQSIEELEEKGVIDEEVKNRATSQSNIDAMAQQAQAQAQAEAAKRKQEMAEDSMRKADEAQAKEDNRRAQEETARTISAAAPNAISNKQMKLMSLALVLKVLSQDKVTTILNKFNSNDSLTISQYMNMANLESQLDSDLVADCLKEMKSFLPIKKKLTKENVVLDLINIYKTNPREKIEKVLKQERPLVKRFVSQAYDGEYGELPLKVAGIVTEYIEENL
ncbi:MAG: hypothetical protein E7Z92_01580 [Cyanobacteria bacterium SIG31]|nr:hypothetical protein [Cyanobacteria bacterium SIG31]